MGAPGVNRQYQDCLDKGKIKQFSRGKTLVNKELEIALSDLAAAEKSFAESDCKWATIQVYYSMFHSARALLYAKNLREHSHYCLIKAIQYLYVDKGLLATELLDALQEAKDLREEADYHNRWSERQCRKLLNRAREFRAKTAEIVTSSIT